MSYLSYETENRQIITSQVNVIELNFSSNSVYRNFSDIFKFSFVDVNDAYHFLKFFEVDNNLNYYADMRLKYVKCTLTLYHNNIRFDFYGSFPQEINYYDLQNTSITIYYDHFQNTIPSELDELFLKAQTRNFKLESIGI